MMQQQYQTPLSTLGEQENLTTLKGEIERMVADGKVSTGQPDVGRDPKAFVAHAARMLMVAKSQLVRHNAMHQARRAQMLNAFHEQLLNLDQQDDKVAEDLMRLIEKLDEMRQ